MTSRFDPARAALLELQLEADSLEAARRPLPADGEAWSRAQVALLNRALATELVSIVRHKHHRSTLQALTAPDVAPRLEGPAREEMVHAERLAQRIVQLGGQPDFDPHTIVQWNRWGPEDQPTRQVPIKVKLAAQRIAIESCIQMVRLVGDRDQQTRRLLEELLADKLRHAEECCGGWSD